MTKVKKSFNLSSFRGFRLCSRGIGGHDFESVGLLPPPTMCSDTLERLTRQPNINGQPSGKGDEVIE